MYTADCLPSMYTADCLPRSIWAEGPGPGAAAPRAETKAILLLPDGTPRSGGCAGGAGSDP